MGMGLKGRFTQKGLLKDQGKDRLKTGKEYDILEQTFYRIFKQFWKDIT